MRRTRRSVQWGTALLLLVGCASEAATSSTARQPQLARGDLARIRALAPDFLARAEGAAVEARGAEGEARTDHEVRSVLLMEAAQVEADRIELERRRAAYEAEALAAEQTATEADRQRLAIEAELRLSAAATAAAEQARQAFAEVQRAAEPTASGRVEREQARALASAFVVRRARLTLAAAQALGAAEARIAEARRAIDEARAVPAARAGELQALRSAERALLSAQQALGDARARAASPTAADADDLSARALELGFAASRGSRGVVIELPKSFAPGASRLSSAAAPKLHPLVDLLAAFPHGPIVIETNAQASSSAQAVRLTPARSARLSALLSRTVVAERIESAAFGASTGADTDARLVLPAYGSER